MVELNELLRKFRFTGRELFNFNFRFARPGGRSEAWDLADRFAEVERILYQNLVLYPGDLREIAYGEVHPEVEVVPEVEAEILVNREICSGYWDHPAPRARGDEILHFIQFFDWDLLGVRDNQFVRVRIVQWAGHPELAGKHALIEARYVVFRKVANVDLLETER